MSVTPDRQSGMRWSEISAEQPAFARLAHTKLITPGVLLVGTTRRDGTARISAVEPLIMDGELWLSMMRSSTKALDLRRDPRVVLNSIVLGPEADDEVKVRGTAEAENDREVGERYAHAVATELGWQPVVDHFALFRIDIDDVIVVGYEPDTHAQQVAHWPAGVEYRRPATTPTSLGKREPVHRLLG
jgi:Pyridoxamine 5'-phosphate oxidase